MKNNKIILTLILVLTIGIVGLTIAYFSNSSTITNTFNTNPYGTTVTEEFVSPDNWLPGTSTDKSLTVTNSGQVDEAVRISYIETWTSRSAKNNDEEGDLPLSQNGNTAALIHFTNTDDWTTVTENGTTYRYYNYKLEPNQTTSELLDYVTFNPAITNSSNCIETPTATGKTITCNSTGDGYDDATYKLTFTIETVQYNKYKEAWGTNVNILEEEPLMVYGLNVNSKLETYETGDKHQMFEFEHPTTVQTPSLTDYRYIGDEPYNFVYFNCDDLNNQNSDTCETWRIIGVFYVDDGTGNYEQRIKLLGSILYETQYDLNSANEWTQSNLKSILNNDYYNSLKDNAKDLISSVKYYLGSTTSKYPEIPVFGSTEEIYSWERGNLVYDSSPIYWIGNIALMYPSDHYYTYSKGVDNICFNDPVKCYFYENEWNEYGDPQTSWIYNSDIYNDSISPTWFITSYPNNNDISFFMVTNGELSFYFNDGYYDPMGVRPTLYLSSSVNIIDGDGSINNPYKLSNS